jgi:hypothetical protein
LRVLHLAASDILSTWPLPRHEILRLFKH